MNPASIMNAIKTSANACLALNLVMHLLVIGTLLALFLVPGSRTRRYVFDTAILALSVSVATISILGGNPFNMAVFGIIAIISAIELVRGMNQVNVPRLSANTIVGFLFVLTGFWYPEFVKASPLLMPVVSPLGAIPCPMFLVMLGMLTLCIPHVNRLQFVTTAALGLFYGITGVLQLGVYLDLVLLAAALYSFWNFRLVFGKRKQTTVKADARTMVSRKAELTWRERV